MRILIIEDDQETALTLKDELKKYFTIELAFNAEDGEYQASVNEFDLILLDYLLPDSNGLTVLKNLRQIGVDTPVLMLTGESSITKKIEAFNQGSDDYLTKPYSMEELLARIRALLRRAGGNINSNTLIVGDLILDLNDKTVRREETQIQLRRKEFDILEYLMRNAGRVLSREMIINHVWDSANESITNIIDVHIKYLRDRIDKPFHKKMIRTVHGFGYKLDT